MRLSPILIGPAGAPVWPDGLIGSISHCAELAAAVVGFPRSHERIGIDVEVRGAVTPAVASRICTPDELAWCANASRAEGPAGWETVVFSAKESAFKAWSRPRVRRPDFRAVRLDLTEPVEGTGSFTVSWVAPTRDPELSRLAGRYAVGGAVVATCVVAGRSA